MRPRTRDFVDPPPSTEFHTPGNFRRSFDGDANDQVKPAANEMALKDVDKVVFDQRMSLAVVTIFDEEGEIDIMARSDIWPGDYCAPRICVKATCSAFPPGLEVLERRGRVHALRVENCPVTGQSTSP